MDQEDLAERYFQLEMHDGVGVVRFVDLQIGPDARAPLYGLVENQGLTRIVLDLENIEALSSFALGILASFQNRAEASGGRVRLCGINAYIRQLLRMTKFDQIFEIRDTQAEALRDF